MRTKTKIWLGIGAFAVVQAAGVSYEAGRPVLTVAQTAEAKGTCGWSQNDHGRWYYDSNCEKGERYVPRPGYSYGNERGERWDRHYDNWPRGFDRSKRPYNDGRWERGERGNERGERGRGQWEHGEKGERWGERG